MPFDSKSRLIEPREKAPKQDTMLTTSIRLRYYQNGDRDRVRMLFRDAMCTGSDSPRRHLFRHELKSPRAFLSYATFLLGLVLRLSNSRTYHLTSSALLILGFVPLLAHLLFSYSAFMAFVNGSINGPDMVDVPKCYGMIASPDPANRGSLVPYGKNAFWVAEAHNPNDPTNPEVVGCVGLDINTNPGDISAELRRFAVSTKYRGRGIGRQLIETLVAHARQTGVENVWLRTSSSNVGAICMYQRVGFKVTEEYVEFKNLDTHILSMDVPKCAL